jgi:hypothetical protein
VSLHLSIQAVHTAKSLFGHHLKVDGFAAPAWAIKGVLFADVGGTKPWKPSETTKTASKTASTARTEMRNCVLPALKTALKAFHAQFTKSETLSIPSGKQLSQFVTFYCQHLIQVSAVRSKSGASKGETSIIISFISFVFNHAKRPGEEELGGSDFKKATAPAVEENTSGNSAPEEGDSGDGATEENEDEEDEEEGEEPVEGGASATNLTENGATKGGAIDADASEGDTLEGGRFFPLLLVWSVLGPYSEQPASFCEIAANTAPQKSIKPAPDMTPDSIKAMSDHKSSSSFIPSANTRERANQEMAAIRHNAEKVEKNVAIISETLQQNSKRRSRDHLILQLEEALSDSQALSPAEVQQYRSNLAVLKKARLEDSLKSNGM